MPPIRTKRAYRTDDAHESLIQAAISDLKKGQFKSRRAAARAYNVTFTICFLFFYLTHF